MNRILTFLFLALAAGAFAQPQRHKKQPLEFSYGIGCSNYLGELGGGNKKGTHRSPIDLELKQTKPALTMGVRKSLSLYRALKANLTFAQVAGNDQLTREQFRQNRNLNFKSNILEINCTYEFGFTNIQQGQRYLSKVQGMRNRYHYTYFYAGIGAFAFNPKGFYKNHWYALQPLGTEGQGINGHKKYSRVSICIPVGMGFKMKIKQRHFVGVEFAYRFTFTDYLDDVSTSYHNNIEIAEQRGALAAHFADPSLNKLHKEVTSTGEQRGNPLQKDGYLILTVSYSKQTHKKFRGLFSNF
jgi:hypothetical protein